MGIFLWLYRQEKKRHIQSESLIIAAIIMVEFYCWEEILNRIEFMNSSMCLIIFFLALEMILGISIFSNDAPETASPVPLAFPMIAGAGTMTSLLSLRAEYQVLNIILPL